MMIFINPKAERGKIKIRGCDSKETMRKKIIMKAEINIAQILKKKKAKSWFFETTNKINKLQMRLK